MRIIGEFDLGHIKASVFKMNERLSVKYEHQLMEQIYKFRDGSGIKSVEDIRTFSQSIQEELIQSFETMAALRWKGIQSMREVTDHDEDEII